MKYIVSENQHELIRRVKLYKATKETINEQEFIAQQPRVYINENESEDRHVYTVEVEFLGAIEDYTNEELDKLDNRNYANILLKDIRKKIQEAFHTQEIRVTGLHTKSRGTII